MKTLLMLSALLFSQMTFAETITYDVAGMHCGGCVKMIQSKVCTMSGIEKCDVSMGKVVISPKTGISFTNEQIQAAVAKAGDYKITGSKTSK